MDAVGDYVKTHGDSNIGLTLENQLNHLQTQKEVLERWKATLARMGVVVEDEWIDDGMPHFDHEAQEMKYLADVNCSD